MHSNMRVNLRVIQVLGDLLIPIIGYFLWGWGLFFIVLYYLLDLIVSEFFMHLKTRSMRLSQKTSMFSSLGYIALGMALIGTTLLLIRVFMLQIHPEMNLIQEIVNFWNYKDMGIAQGYVLIP